MHIEVKHNDTWHHYAAPHMFRNRVFLIWLPRHMAGNLLCLLVGCLKICLL